MFLKELVLKDYRNYDSIKMKFCPTINIICGNNAQGKTNLLESIYVLGLTKSHRLNGDNNLIKTGMTQCKIKGTIEDNKNKETYEVIINEEKKILKINNFEVKKTSEYISKNINIIIFYPQDLEIIQGSPSIRRNYLNLELSQLSDNYLKILIEFNKILKIRNDYLKKMYRNIKVDINYFNIITGYLIDKAIILCKMRDKFINEINNNCDNIFYEITKKEHFNIEYKTNFDFKSENSKEVMTEKYQKIIKKEIKMGSTLVGPHRDDLIFNLEKVDLKEFGSQGQQRIAVLSMKLSEIDIFEKYKQRKPLLLLDDVFSELDNVKKKNIINYLKRDIQVIITTTDLRNINKKVYENGKVFKIKEGKVINLEEVN